MVPRLNSAFAKSLLLDDNSSAAHLVADDEITDLDLHEIAAAQFAVDGKAEQRPVPNPSMLIEKEPNCPCLRGLSGRFTPTFHPAFEARRPSAPGSNSDMPIAFLP
jgi:hypothetical protein